MQQTEAYTGVDNLEVMREAVNYNRYLLDLVRKHAPPSGRVLDFGAGGGQFAQPLAQQGMNIVALEPDFSLRQQLEAQGLQAAESTEQLADESIAYIYTLNVLEHIEDDLGTLRQLYRKLMRGGRLMIYVPAFPILYTSMDAKVGHIRRYRKHTLRQAVTEAGFSVERVGYVDSLGFFATLAFKLIGNESGDVNRAALKAYDRMILPLSLAIDGVTNAWFGKNVLLVATKR